MEKKKYKKPNSKTILLDSIGTLLTGSNEGIEVVPGKDPGVKGYRGSFSWDDEDEE